jgi:hypothetical protein
MKSFITLVMALGMGLSANAEIKRGTIVGAYRLTQPTEQGFNILVEAVENPRFSNQRLFYLAEEQNDKILRKGQMYEAQIIYEARVKSASLYSEFSHPFPVAKFDVSQSGIGHLRGKMDNEILDARISVIKNCRTFLEKNNL